MSEIISIPILELMEKTEQWLLNQGYKKNTLGVYKATWNKFRAFVNLQPLLSLTMVYLMSRIQVS